MFCYPQLNLMNDQVLSAPFIYSSTSQFITIVIFYIKHVLVWSLMVRPLQILAPGSSAQWVKHLTRDSKAFGSHMYMCWCSHLLINFRCLPERTSCPHQWEPQTCQLLLWWEGPLVCICCGRTFSFTFHPCKFLWYMFKNNCDKNMKMGTLNKLLKKKRKKAQIYLYFKAKKQFFWWAILIHSYFLK